jgi:hypothetical protein
LSELRSSFLWGVGITVAMVVVAGVFRAVASEPAARPEEAAERRA